MGSGYSLDLYQTNSKKERRISNFTRGIDRKTVDSATAEEVRSMVAIFAPVPDEKITEIDTSEKKACSASERGPIAGSSKQIDQSPEEPYSKITFDKVYIFPPNTNNPEVNLLAKNMIILFNLSEEKPLYYKVTDISVRIGSDPRDDSESRPLSQSEAAGPNYLLLKDKPRKSVEPNKSEDSSTTSCSVSEDSGLITISITIQLTEPFERKINGENVPMHQFIRESLLSPTSHEVSQSGNAADENVEYLKMDEDVPSPDQVLISEESDKNKLDSNIQEQDDVGSSSQKNVSEPDRKRKKDKNTSN